MIKIYDNFLTKTYHKEIENLMLSYEFPWFYASNISNDSGVKDNKNEFGFFHIFIKDNGEINSNYSDFIKPLLYQIMDVTNTKTILRARGDMTTNKNKKILHEPHVDFQNENLIRNKSVVFYVNNSDGDTVIYNEIYTADFRNEQHTVQQTVSPKANRLLVFDGNILHTGCSPIEYASRVLINSNFI